MGLEEILAKPGSRNGYRNEPFGTEGSEIEVDITYIPMHLSLPTRCRTPIGHEDLRIYAGFVRKITENFRFNNLTII